MTPRPCPRCHDGAALSLREVETEAGRATLRVCEGCGGLFLAKDQLAICPTVAHLPANAYEVTLTGALGAGITGCPGCGAAPYQLELAGVAVDFCVGCHGVWLDGHDFQEAAFAARSDRDARTGDPYRASAREIEGPRGLEPCADCGGRFAPNELGFWEHGRICRSCRQVRDLHRAERRAATERTWLDALVDLLTR